MENTYRHDQHGNTLAAMTSEEHIDRNDDPKNTMAPIINTQAAITITGTHWPWPQGQTDHHSRTHLPSWPPQEHTKNHEYRRPHWPPWPQGQTDHHSYRRTHLPSWTPQGPLWTLLTPQKNTEHHECRRTHLITVMITQGTLTTITNAETHEGGGGVWRVIIPVLQVKGKNSCVQLFLPFFWRANRKFYKQKKRT